MPVSISAPVGMTSKARNLAADVTSVQSLLNGVAPADGGPKVPLKVDGIAGPKTCGAIQAFQLRQLGQKIADGRVDPGGQTLAKLNLLTSAVDPNDNRALRCNPAPGFGKLS